MTYSRAQTYLLIRETDNAGELVTHAERALRNQIQSADDEIVRLECLLAHRAALNSDLWPVVEDVAIGTQDFPQDHL